MSTNTAIYCDGLCQPNPGGLAIWAFVVYAIDGQSYDEVHNAAGLAFERGPHATNNVAEYVAVGKALVWFNEATEPELNGLTIYTDSRLVVEQVNGIWNCKNEYLAKLCKRTQELLYTSGGRLLWIPRGENERADELTREEFRRHTGRYPPER